MTNWSSHKDVPCACLRLYVLNSLIVNQLTSHLPIIIIQFVTMPAKLRLFEKCSLLHMQFHSMYRALNFVFLAKQIFFSQKEYWPFRSIIEMPTIIIKLVGWYKIMGATTRIWEITSLMHLEEIYISGICYRVRSTLAVRVYISSLILDIQEIVTNFIIVILFVEPKNKSVQGWPVDSLVLY